MAEFENHFLTSHFDIEALLDLPLSHYPVGA